MKALRTFLQFEQLHNIVRLNQEYNEIVRRIEKLSLLTSYSQYTTQEWLNKGYSYDELVNNLKHKIEQASKKLSQLKKRRSTSEKVTVLHIDYDCTRTRREVANSYRYFRAAWNPALYLTRELVEYRGYLINKEGHVVLGGAGRRLESTTGNIPRNRCLEFSFREHLFKNFTLSPKFRIGIEIEKEDKAVLQSIAIEDFLAKTDHLFKKVQDSSLSQEEGYELITPALELIPEKIDTFLKSYPVVVDHINGDYSPNCGGHINLSENGLTGEEFFDKIKGYTPLLYALNPTRIHAYWSRAKATETLKKEKEKAQAIAIWSDRVELRIFSAVENYDQLMWRVQLCYLLCNYPTSSFETAFFNCHTILKEHLKKGYENNYFDPHNQYQTYDDFLNAIVEHTLSYENVTLSKVNQ